MQILRDHLDIDGFFDRLGQPGGGLLLLDYDGTLAPFRKERMDAVPYPGVRELLSRIRAAGRALEGPPPIVVSGRPAEEVAALLGTDPLPEIWGCHGWERRDASGRLHRIDPGEPAVAGLRDAHEEAARLAPPDRLEHKGAAVAVHFRGLEPDREEELGRRIAGRWEALVRETPALELRSFDGGLEVRAGARDKGSAVRELLDRTPPDVPAAYLGDDDTDEDAFEAMRAAAGLAVLVRDELRPTAADVWIRPPDELLDFLRRWSRTLSSRIPGSPAGS